MYILKIQIQSVWTIWGWIWNSGTGETSKLGSQCPHFRGKLHHHAANAVTSLSFVAWSTPNPSNPIQSQHFSIVNIPKAFYFLCYPIPSISNFRYRDSSASNYGLIYYIYSLSTRTSLFTSIYFPTIGSPGLQIWCQLCSPPPRGAQKLPGLNTMLPDNMSDGMSKKMERTKRTGW